MKGVKWIQQIFQKRIKLPCLLLVGFFLSMLSVFSLLNTDASADSSASTYRQAETWISYSIGNTYSPDTYNGSIFANNLVLQTSNVLSSGGMGVKKLYNMEFRTAYSWSQFGDIGDSTYEFNEFTWIIPFYVPQGSVTNLDRINPQGVFYVGDSSVNPILTTAIPATCKFYDSPTIPPNENANDPNRKVTYVLGCNATSGSYYRLQGFDIYLNDLNMNSDTNPVFTICDSDNNIGCSSVIAGGLTITYNASNIAPESSGSSGGLTSTDIDDALDDYSSRQKQQYESQQQTISTDIGGFTSGIGSRSSSLLQVFNDFVTIVANTEPANSCNMNIDLFSTTAYGVGSSAQVYTVDLCQLPVPSVVGILGAIVIAGICALLSLSAFRMLLNMLEEYAR